MSSLNGVHSQDALGVLPEGSVSPRMIPSLEKVHITSNNLGYKGPLSSIRGISEGPAQLQSISRDLFRPLLGLNSAELSPMSGHTLLCSRALHGSLFPRSKTARPLSAHKTLPALLGHLPALTSSHSHLATVFLLENTGSDHRAFTQAVVSAWSTLTQRTRSPLSPLPPCPNIP